MKLWHIAISVGCCLWLLGCSDRVHPYAMCESNSDCSENQHCVSRICSSLLVQKSEPSVGEGVLDKTSEPNPTEHKEKKTEKPVLDGSISDASSPEEGVPESTIEYGPEKPRNCVESATQSCYTGDPKTRDVGECEAGIQVCKDGDWGECFKQTLPEKERCGDKTDNDCDGTVDEDCPCEYKGQAKGVCLSTIDNQGQCRKPTDYSEKELCGDNKDNDCNGKSDDGCACSPGNTRSCGSSVGECRAGKQKCGSNGQWNVCDGQGPNKETCDGKDNNCDGVTDEDCSCDFSGLSKGVCKDSTIDRQGQCRRPAQYQIKEICGDKLDNNCDGVVDEGCSCTYLGKALGVCKLAIRDNQGQCQKPSGYNSSEMCDNKDNNCDGIVDNYKKACKNQCGSGMNTCQYGRWQGCSAPTPQTEVCGDSKDNDCDGSTDEYCPCNYNNNSNGVCATAKRDNLGKCSIPGGYATSEVCGDGKDNNCNGVIDEYCSCNYLGKTRGVCTQAKRDGKGNCIAPTGYNAAESCDNKDNNCDGRVDGQSRSCSGNCGANGTQVCSGGSWGVCTAGTTGVAEVCGDGKDNNCNGAVDENCSCNYKDINKGVCTQAKRNAKGVCEAPKGYAASETCGDRLDNNCNGDTDKFPSTQTCYTTKSCRFNNGSSYKICGNGAYLYCSGTRKICQNSTVCTKALKCSTDADCSPCPGGASKYSCKYNYCIKK